MTPITDAAVCVRGKWKISGHSEHGTSRIYCDDFTHDACLQLTGDFGTQAERVAYAQAICDRLNAVAENSAKDET